MLGVAVAAAMLLDMVMLATGMRESFRELLLSRGFEIRLAPKGTLPFDTDATIPGVTAITSVLRTNPDIREACEASISGHAAKVEADIAEAMKRYGVRAPWTAESLALHTQAVLQGAFIVAKAKGSAASAAASIDHLRRYIVMLFKSARPKSKETT